MIVLFFGDIVGEEAAKFTADAVGGLRSEYGADLVIANAENCAPDGLGMGAEQIDWLVDAGVDVITGGNHSWDDDETVELLAHPRIVRPLNLEDLAPGRGEIEVDVDGETVTVLNLADACSMKGARAVSGLLRPAYPVYAGAPKRGTVIVDYHGDHVIEKQIFARAVDGEVAAVLGTHTHEATLPLEILPGGTALVTDVGMCGPLGGVQGFAYDGFVRGLKRTGNPFSEPLPTPLDGPIVLGAVVLEISAGRTTRLERVPAGALR